MSSKPQSNIITLIVTMLGGAVLLLLLLMLALTMWNIRKKVDFQSQSPEQEVFSYTTPEPLVKPEEEVRSHFEELGQVKRTLRAGSAAKLQTEKEAMSDLKKRGFDQFDITSSYDADGHWVEEIVISADGKMEHPLYETFFVPDEETLWVIYDYSGSIMAKPVLHPSLADEDTPVYLSETGTLMCFDAYNNTFYEIIPSPETAKVFQVSKVDSDTLIHWTYEEGNAQ